jgi:glutathione S-transferase
MLTIHHLYQSRSERILFLVKQLDIPHLVVPYHRDVKTLLAPPTLRAVHPLGSAPVITDHGLVLAESGAIMSYIVDKYGHGRLLPEPHTPAWYHCQEWMHFNEGTLMAGWVDLMFLAMAGQRQGPAVEMLKMRLDRYTNYLNAAVAEQGYLCGSFVTVADIMTVFSLDFITDSTFPDLFHTSIASLPPALQDYLLRMRSLPGYAYSQRRDFTA